MLARAAATLLVLLFSACTGRERSSNAENPDTVTVAAGAAAAAVAAAAEPRELDLCALMPVSDVSAILQSKLGGAGAVTAARQGAGGMCSYDNEIDGRRTVRLLIDLTDYGSADRARDAQANLRQIMQERALAVEELAGVGDAAFASREGEMIGVKVRARTYGGQVNLSVG